MKRVFISRILEEHSIFKQLLQTKQFEVQGLSLIAFSPVSFVAPKQVDWLFFYSKKAVQFFFDGLTIQEKTYFKQKKIAAMGNGTSEALSLQGCVVHFTGDGNPEHTAAALLEVVEEQTVLFPRAQQSRQSVQKKLAGKIIMRDLVVYRNVPKQDFSVIQADYLVFTSPLNVEAYFSKYAVEQHQVLIAIGPTTASSLKAHGIAQFLVSPAPSEVALAKTILQHQND